MGRLHHRPKARAPASVEWASTAHRAARPARARRSGRRAPTCVLARPESRRDLQVEERGQDPAPEDGVPAPARRQRRHQRLQKVSSSAVVRAGFRPSWWPIRCRGPAHASVGGPRPPEGRSSFSRPVRGPRQSATGWSWPAPLEPSSSAQAWAGGDQRKVREQLAAAPADGHAVKGEGLYHRMESDQRSQAPRSAPRYGRAGRSMDAQDLFGLLSARPPPSRGPSPRWTGRCVSASRKPRDPRGWAWCG